MSIKNFLQKFSNEIAEKTAQNVDECFDKRLAEISGRLQIIENRQKETSLQIEEIDNLLQSDNDENIFISALISLTDIIEDFYHYAAADKDSELFEQAQMMWNAAKNKTEAAGLSIIDSDEEPYDFNIHSTESTEWDDSLPSGYITKILKCGYIYKDEVIRRAAVIVNKDNEDEETET